MTDNGQLDFLDLISIMSFIIGLENLEMNITQNDIERQTADIDKRVSDYSHKLLDEIHSHLEKQDIRLSAIEETLKEIKNGI